VRQGTLRKQPFFELGDERARIGFAPPAPGVGIGARLRLDRVERRYQGESLARLGLGLEELSAHVAPAVGEPQRRAIALVSVS